MEENQKQDLKSRSAMPAKTLILIIVLAVAAILLLSFALKQKNIKLPVNLTETAVETPADTFLSVSENPVPFGNSYTDDILIDTGKNTVTGVQLELIYDPKALITVDVTPGTFFEDSNVLIKKIDTVNGRITYALGVALGEKGKMGKGVIASLHFGLNPSVIKPITTTISFLPKTQVSSQDTIESVLSRTSSAKLTLDGKPPSPIEKPQ